MTTHLFKNLVLFSFLLVYYNVQYFIRIKLIGTSAGTYIFKTIGYHF